MFDQLSNNVKAILLAIIGFSAFSVSDAAAKILSEYYHVTQVVAGNAFVTVGILLLLSSRMGGLETTLQTKKLKLHIARGICNTAISVLVVLSFSQLPLATSYTLFFISPFIITVLAIPIYKEQIDLHGWIAVFVGFSGVLLVFRPGFAELNPWLLVALATAFFIAAQFLLARAVPKEETLLSLGLFPALGNFTFMVPVAWFFYGLPDLEHFPLFLLAGIMIITGLTTTALAFRIGKSSIVGPVHYSQILWAVLFGYTIFGDPLDLWTVCGAAIIIGSGIYLIEAERKIIDK